MASVDRQGPCQLRVGTEAVICGQMQMIRQLDTDGWAERTENDQVPEAQAPLYSLNKMQ